MEVIRPFVMLAPINHLNQNCEFVEHLGCQKDLKVNDFYHVIASSFNLLVDCLLKQ